MAHGPTRVTRRHQTLRGVETFGSKSSSHFGLSEEADCSMMVKFLLRKTLKMCISRFEEHKLSSAFRVATLPLCAKIQGSHMSSISSAIVKTEPLIVAETRWL